MGNALRGVRAPAGTALIAVLAVLAACAGAPGPGSAQAAVVLDASAESAVVLRAGQELVVRLRSNPSTGYGWQLAQGAATVLAPAGAAAFEPDATAQGRVGAGGIETWRFRAIATGRGALRFEYRRPWEKDASPASTAAVDVEVRAGGS